MADETEITETPPLAREEFTEEALPNEPATDRKLVLSDGTALRERLVSIQPKADNVASSADVAPTSLTVKISNALLNDDGSVATDGNGAFKIAPAHELVLTGEALANLGTKAAVEGAVEDARQIAAALAQRHFEGMALAQSVLGSRLA